MLTRISNSWELVKASARVLSLDKELLIFPIVSAVGVVAVTALFIIPALLGSLFDSFFSESFGVFGTVLAFLYYIVQYTIVFFSNTALVGAAMIRIRGGNPTVMDGVRIASRQFFNILGYALIASTVGIVLKLISDRSKGLGRFIISIIGLAWNVGTYLVVPILAVEGVGPIEAVKRSVNYLKRTWGEQIIGNFGIGTTMGLLTFVVVIIGIAVLALAAWMEAPLFLLIALGALLGLTLVFLGLISSTLNGIYTAAVYEYAATGEVKGYFDRTIVENAFRLRG